MVARRGAGSTLTQSIGVPSAKQQQMNRRQWGISTWTISEGVVDTILECTLQVPTVLLAQLQRLQNLHQFLPHHLSLLHRRLPQPHQHPPLLLHPPLPYFPRLLQYHRPLLIPSLFPFLLLTLPRVPNRIGSLLLLSGAILPHSLLTPCPIPTFYLHDIHLLVELQVLLQKHLQLLLIPVPTHCELPNHIHQLRIHLTQPISLLRLLIIQPLPPLLILPTSIPPHPLHLLLQLLAIPTLPLPALYPLPPHQLHNILYLLLFKLMLQGVLLIRRVEQKMDGVNGGVQEIVLGHEGGVHTEEGGVLVDLGFVLQFQLFHRIQWLLSETEKSSLRIIWGFMGWEDIMGWFWNSHEVVDQIPFPAQNRMAPNQVASILSKPPFPVLTPSASLIPHAHSIFHNPSPPVSSLNSCLNINCPYYKQLEMSFMDQKKCFFVIDCSTQGMSKIFFREEETPSYGRCSALGSVSLRAEERGLESEKEQLEDLGCMEFLPFVIPT